MIFQPGPVALDPKRFNCFKDQAAASSTKSDIGVNIPLEITLIESGDLGIQKTLRFIQGECRNGNFQGDV